MLAMVLAAAETALTRVSRPRAEDLAAEPAGEALTPCVELVGRPEQFVTTVVFLLLVCQIVQATLVGILADRLFGVVGMVVAIAIDVVVVFVLAESRAEDLGRAQPRPRRLAVARPVRRVAHVPAAAPGHPGPDRAHQPGAAGPGADSRARSCRPRSELLAVAELGVEEGVIEEDERALIESIIEFGDTLVREVMVPRPDMVTVASALPGGRRDGGVPAQRLQPAAGVRRRPRRRRRPRLRQGPDGRRARRQAGRPGASSWPARPASCPRPSGFRTCCGRCSGTSSTWRSWSTSTGAPPGWSRSRTSSRSWWARSSTSSTSTTRWSSPWPAAASGCTAARRSTR